MALDMMTAKIQVNEVKDEGWELFRSECRTELGCQNSEQKYEED